MTPATSLLSGTGATPRVLIVDTDTAPSAYLDERFGTGVLEVDVAADGDVAVEWARQSPPDLVLVNAALPGALEAVEGFKRDAQLGGIPVVVMAPVPASFRLVRHWFGASRADLYVRSPLQGTFLARFVSHVLGAGAVRGTLDEESRDTADDEGSVVGTWRERAVAAEGTIEDALTRARRAENDLGMMRLDVEELRQKLAAAEENHEPDGQMMLDDTGELEIQAQVLQRRLAELELQLRRRGARAEAAEKDLHGRLAELVELRRDNRAYKADNDRLRSKEVTLIADLEKLALTESRLRQRVMEYRGQLGSLRGDDSEDASLEMEDVAVDSAEVDREAHERAVRAEQDLQRKNAELQEIQQDIVAVQTENTRLQSQTETLRGDLDLLYDREQAMADERAAAQHKAQKMLHTVAEQQERIADGERRIQELQDQLAERDRQIKILGKLSR